MEDISRRKVLLGTAGVTTAAIAGCVSGDSGTDDDGSGNTSGVQKRSITHTGSDCAGPEPDTVTVISDENTYTIEGSLPSSTPCYEPELVGVESEDGTLSVTVDVVADGTDDCVECTGQVNYDANVELSSGTAVETVSVTHESGETHTVEQSAFVNGYPEITSASIKTTRADSRSGDATGDAELDIGKDAVTISGTILTSTPHYEAVLTETSVQRRQLEVTVDAESTLDEGQAGTTVRGVVEYEATIEMGDIDTLTGAKVRHPNSAYGFGWDEESASASRSVSKGNSTADGPNQ